MVIARSIGASGAGVYFLSLTFLTVGGTLARFGMDNVVLRHASIFFSQSNYIQLCALYKKSFCIIGLFGGGLTLLGWVLISTLSASGYITTDLHLALSIIIFSLVPSSLILVQGEFLRSIERPESAVLIQSFLLPCTMLLGLALVYFYSEISIRVLSLLYLACSTLVFLLAVGMWRWLLRREWDITGSFDANVLLGSSAPLLWASLMGLVMGSADIIVLGFFAEPSVVGVYGVAARASGVLSVVFIAVNSVLAPQMAVLHSKRDGIQLKKLYKEGGVRIAIISTPVLVGMLVFPNQLLSMFGEEFSSGGILLQILVLGQLANIMAGPIMKFLMMIGESRATSHIMTGTALLNLAGTIVFVRFYGAVGAAISTALSLIIFNAVSVAYAFKIVEIPQDIPS